MDASTARGTRARLPALLLSLALVLAALAGGAARGEDVAYFEAEGMTFGTYAEGIPDSAALNGTALRFNSNGRASKTLTTAKTVEQIVVRSRIAFSSDSFVTQRVLVDGAVVGNATIRAAETAYDARAYTLATPLAPNTTHKIEVVAIDANTKDALVADRVTLRNSSPAVEARALGAAIPDFPTKPGEPFDYNQAVDAIDAYNAKTQAGGAAEKVKFAVMFEEFGRYDIAKGKYDAAASRGVVPVVTLEPKFAADNSVLTRIAQGEFDGWIKNQADIIDASNAPRVIVRFAHEMNGGWYPWGCAPEVEGNDDCTLAVRSAQAEKYRAAFARVHDQFALHTNKVEMMFAPNRDFPISEYYPGNAEVDWLAVDGYAGTKTASGEKTADTYGPEVDILKGLDGQADKPIMVSETATCEGPTKADYIRSIHNDTAVHSPEVDAVGWFDRDTSARGECNFRFDADAESLAAYRAMVDDPAWQGALR